MDPSVFVVVVFDTTELFHGHLTVNSPVNIGSRSAGGGK